MAAVSCEYSSRKRSGTTRHGQIVVESRYFHAEIVVEPRNRRDYRRSSVTFKVDSVSVQIRGLTLCTNMSRRTDLK